LPPAPPQALLYRLRQDVAAAGRDPAVLDTLRSTRELEYEVDYLTNKIRVGGGVGGFYVHSE
jgi:hypothetical protein